MFEAHTYVPLWNFLAAPLQDKVSNPLKELLNPDIHLLYKQWARPFLKEFLLHGSSEVKLHATGMLPESPYSDM